MFEIVSFAGEVGECQVPYQNCVPNDPSIEDMKRVVVTQELRPDIDQRWSKNEVRELIHPFQIRLLIIGVYLAVKCTVQSQPFVDYVYDSLSLSLSLR